MTRLLALTLLIGFFAFLPSASADGGNGLHIIPADVHQSASSSTAMLTLKATNIQVRAKWRLDGDSPFAITDHGELRLTAELSDPTTIVATVIVEDMFSELNSGYQNLAATVLITVEFISGTLRIVNPPARLLAASGMGGTVAFETSGGMGEQIFVIDSASDYFTLGETSGILSVAASVVVGEYAMTIWVQDETATLSITVVAEVGVPENLIVVGIPPLTITVSDVLALHTLQASGGLGGITYKILGSAGHFFIIEKSGVLWVNGGASEGVYVLSVEAADEAIIPQKATAVATVAVENNKKIIPLTVKATASDSSIDLHKFTLQYASSYSIVAGDDGGYFWMGKISGILQTRYKMVPEAVYTLSIEITYQYSLGIPPTKLISVVVVEMSLIPPPIKSQIFAWSGGGVWSSVDGKSWGPKIASGIYFLFSDLVVHNGRIYLLKESENDSVWSSVNGVNWTLEMGNATSLLYRRDSHAVVHNGRIYLLGGASWDNDSIYYNDVWSSADGKSWRQEKANNNVGWLKRKGHQAVSHNGRLYVLGGHYIEHAQYSYNDVWSSYNDVWSSADGKSWTREKANNNSGWSRRVGHRALSHNGRLYVLGGFGWTYWNNGLNDVWSSVDGKSWTQETANSGWSTYYDIVAGGYQVVSHNGRMYLLGGFDAEDFSSDEVWSSVDGKNWLQEAEIASLSSPHAVVFPPNLVLSSSPTTDELIIPNGHIGIIYTFDAQYGDGNYTYKLLPDISGFSINANGELLTDGTATLGEHTITVQVEDGVGQTAIWTAGKVIIICAHCNKAAK